MVVVCHYFGCMERYSYTYFVCFMAVFVKKINEKYKGKDIENAQTEELVEENPMEEKVEASQKGDKELLENSDELSQGESIRKEFNENITKDKKTSSKRAKKSRTTSKKISTNNESRI